MRRLNSRTLTLFTLALGSLGLLLALAARLRSAAAAATPALLSPPEQPSIHDSILHAIRDEAAKNALGATPSGVSRSLLAGRFERPAVSTPSLLAGRGPGGGVVSATGVRVHNRNHLFAGVLTVAFVVPWFLPRPASSLLFAVMVMASLGVAAWGRREFIGRWIGRIARAIASPFSFLYAKIMAYRAWLSVGLAWAAVAVMIYSAFLFLPAHGVEILPEAAQYTLLGGIVLGASMLLAPRLPRKPPLLSLPMPAAHSLDSVRFRRVTVLLGLLGLALTAEISGDVLHTGLVPVISHHLQFVLLCASLVLLTWGLGGRLLPLSMQWRATEGSPCGRGWGVRIAELAAVLALSALAFTLRWWMLGEAVHFFVDEVNFVTAVLEFRTSHHVPLLAPFSSLTAFPWLYPYLQSETVDLFGRNLTGLRAISALFGTLTIPALYLLAKALFDRKTALLAALLLATFPPHIHFSRLGINNIADPLFGTLALAFLARGLRFNRRMDYVVGGVSLGLTQYFYEGGRLLYPPLIILWLGLGALLWDTRLRAHARGLALAGLAALLVAFPIYYSLLGRDQGLTIRMNDAGLNPEYWHNLLFSGDVNAWYAHLDRMRWAFATYVNLPEGSLFYGGGQPLLLGYLVPPFLLGLFYAIWRLRAPGTLLVVLWILLTSVGNSLLIDSTHSTRYVVAFPALALMVAVGVRYIVPLAGLNRLPRRLSYALVGLLVGLLAIGQTAYYFGPHLDRYRHDYWYMRSSHDGQDTAFRAASFPRGAQVHLITQEPYPTLPDDAAILVFLAEGVHIEAYRARDINPDMLSHLPLYVDHAFFVEPSDDNTPLLLQQYFVLEEPQHSPWDVPADREFILYYAYQWRQPRR
jgi:4-amino-4-deoxy-L-arabinose transferase-like glycosyltransferase